MTITALHLCPARVHLAVIRDGCGLDVYNRLTLRALDLGGEVQARAVAFRPDPCEAAGAGPSPRTELVLLGPAGRDDLRRLDLQDGRELPRLACPGASAVQYSGDGRFLAVGGTGGKVQVWHLDAAGLRPERVLDLSCGAAIQALAFHAEHPTLYGLLEGGRLAAFELAPSPAAPLAELLASRAPDVSFTHLAAGPGGFALHLAGADGRVYVADTATGEVGCFDPEVGAILDLQVLPTSGCLCVRGAHAVYVAPPLLPGQGEHLGLHCPFDQRTYAAWELGADALLVFHAGEAA